MFSFVAQLGIIIINVISLVVVAVIDNVKDYAPRCQKAV